MFLEPVGNPQVLKGYKCNSDKECYIHQFEDEFNKMIKMQCDNGACVSKESHLFMDFPKLENDDGVVYGFKVVGESITIPR